MRTFLKILGGLVVLGGAAAGLVFWLTSGMTDTANAFFEKIRSGDNKGAYELTSTGFQSATALPAFDTFVAKNKLKETTSQSWSNRKIEGAGDAAIGTLVGSIQDAKGGSVPARMQLTKRNGKWVVHFIRINTGGATSTTAAKVPDQAKLISLVHEANTQFTSAVEAKSFKAFHAFISDRWRKQITEEKLAKAFEAFIKRDARFGNFVKLTPVLNGPAKIDDKGILRVTGSYDTKPMRIEFRQSYIQENDAWKLFGFGFDMKKAQ
jgi:hypothetical protein